MISDKYIHSKVEDKIYAYWEKNKLFKPQKNSKKFSIVIPPPNVTGSLHMGHALNNSIQDLLIRFHRMNNFENILSKEFTKQFSKEEIFEKFKFRKSKNLEDISHRRA